MIKIVLRPSMLDSIRPSMLDSIRLSMLDSIFCFHATLDFQLDCLTIYGSKFHFFK